MATARTEEPAVNKTVAKQADQLIAVLITDATQTAVRPIWAICAQTAAILTMALALARWW